MKIESGNTNWSQLLKPALLCMNSTLKKSHGNTPFRVMWGRDSRYEDLVPSITGVSVSAEEDVDTEEVIYALYDHNEDESARNVYSLPAEEPQSSISALESFRNSTCDLAGELIRNEQLKQKRQYDKKVNRIRYVILNVRIMYNNSKLQTDQFSNIMDDLMASELLI